MKTRLSDKAKTTLHEDLVLKPKACQSKFGREKENTLNSCLKDDLCKKVKKASLAVYGKNKNNFLGDDIAPLETGKKLMMLRCINREEAMKGKDFVFTVHYIDSVDNFVFDSVLVSKEFVDREKCTNTNSDCLNEMEHNGPNSNKEISESQVGKQKLRMTSKVNNNVVQSNGSDSKDTDKELGKKRNLRYSNQDDLEPVQSKEVVLPHSSEKTIACNTISKGIEANQSLQVQNENGDNIMETANKLDCFPTQTILITTGDMAKNRLKSHCSTPKSLKRNLKDEFANAIHQFKGEKRYIVEVGCNNGLPSVISSVENQEVTANDGLNGKINDIGCSQLSSSAEGTTSHCAKVSEKPTLKMFKNDNKKQISEKEMESATKDSSVEEKSPGKDPTPTSKSKPNVGSQQNSHDRNSNVSSVDPLKKNCDVNDIAACSSCDLANLAVSVQKMLSPAKLNNTSGTAICRKTSLKNDHSHFVGDSKKSKETANVVESNKSGPSCSGAEGENIRNAEVISGTVKTVKPENTSSLTPETTLKKCSNKLQTVTEPPTKENINKVQHEKGQSFAEKSQKKGKRNNKETMQDLDLPDSQLKSMPSENSVSCFRKSSRKRTQGKDNDVEEPGTKRSLRKRSASKLTR